MLLVCPNCSARYLLNSASLGRKGRDVRCAKCAYEWFQESDDPEIEEDVETKTIGVGSFSDEEYESSFDRRRLKDDELKDEIAFIDKIAKEESILDEAIPDSVKPDHDRNLPAFAKDVLRQPVSVQAKINGYFAALTVFALFLLLGTIYKQPIVSAWPPSAAIYKLAGMNVSYKGEKLVMESLSAKISKDSSGQDLLNVQGRVINLTNEIQEVPKLFARLRSTNGEDGEGWSIDTPMERLEPGESFTFKSEYPNVPKGVGSVNLTLVPTVAL